MIQQEFFKRNESALEDAKSAIRFMKKVFLDFPELEVRHTYVSVYSDVVEENGYVDQVKSNAIDVYFNKKSAFDSQHMRPTDSYLPSNLQAEWWGWVKKSHVLFDALAFDESVYARPLTKESFNGIIKKLQLPLIDSKVIETISAQVESEKLKEKHSKVIKHQISGNTL